MPPDGTQNRRRKMCCVFVFVTTLRSRCRRYYMDGWGTSFQFNLSTTTTYTQTHTRNHSLPQHTNGGAAQRLCSCVVGCPQQRACNTRKQPIKKHTPKPNAIIFLFARSHSAVRRAHLVPECRTIFAFRRGVSELNEAGTWDNLFGKQQRARALVLQSV